MSWQKKLINHTELGGPEGILDILAETIKGVFNPNTNAGRTQFRALVIDDSVSLNISDVAQLGGLNIDGAELESVYANTFRQGARVRIIEEDSPHGCLPSPKSILRPDQADLNSIAMHPLAISQVVYEDSFQSTLRPGDVVWCSYERGPDGSKTRNLQIMPKEYIQKADSRVTGLSHRPMAIVMRGPSKSLDEMYGDRSAFTTPTAQETLDYLRSIYPGASEEFLFGLMGNINSESGFDNMIAGDPPRTEYGRERALLGYGLEGVEGDYCSHGHYQMNICTKTAAGTDYIRWASKGTVDPAKDKVETAKLMWNWKSQSEYVKNWMEGAGADPTSSRPPRYGSWTEYIMRDFENCLTCDHDGHIAKREAASRQLRNQLN